MYRRGDIYKTKPGRTYFFIAHPGNPEGSKFLQAIETYCNALINTNGGMLVFGVDKERVVGFELSRSEEDLFKLSFDGAIKSMRPTIHPHQYRLDVIYLDNFRRALFEIRIAAGELEEIYENAMRKMFIVKEKQLYGPLVPCEITQVVLAKYKAELASLIIENNQITITAPPPQEQHDEKSKESVPTCPAKKSRSAPITWP